MFIKAAVYKNYSCSGEAHYRNSHKTSEPFNIRDATKALDIRSRRRNVSIFSQFTEQKLQQLHKYSIVTTHHQMSCKEPTRKYTS